MRRREGCSRLLRFCEGLSHLVLRTRRGSLSVCRSGSHSLCVGEGLSLCRSGSHSLFVGEGHSLCVGVGLTLSLCRSGSHSLIVREGLSLSLFPWFGTGRLPHRLRGGLIESVLAS